MRGLCEHYEQFGDATLKYTVNAYESDGHTLVPILKYFKIPDEDIQHLKQRIVFEIR